MSLEIEYRSALLPRNEKRGEKKNRGFFNELELIQHPWSTKVGSIEVKSFYVNMAFKEFGKKSAAIDRLLWLRVEL